MTDLVLLRFKKLFSCVSEKADASAATGRYFFLSSSTLCLQRVHDFCCVLGGRARNTSVSILPVTSIPIPSTMSRFLFVVRNLLCFRRYFLLVFVVSQFSLVSLNVCSVVFVLFDVLFDVSFASARCFLLVDV